MKGTFSAMVDDPQNLALLALLGSPSSPIAPQSVLIDRRVYKDAALNLDGYTFSNCVFINCSLSTWTGDFRIKDCHLQNVTVYFNGNALRAIRISSCLIGNWQHLNEGLRARIEPDGGVTVE